MGGRLRPMFDLGPHPDDPLDGSAQLHEPLQQSALYARAVTVLGGRCDALDLPSGPVRVVARRFPLLGEVALISRGPAQLDLPTALALRARTGARHLIVHAEDATSAAALAAAGFRRIARPRQIAEVPLAPSHAAMLAAMRGKWRNRLRHGLAQGLTVTQAAMPPDPRHWLLTAEARAARRLGYRPLPPVMIAALAGADPGAGRLFTAHGPDGPIAAMLFFRHGRTATYQVGWSNGAGRAASAGPVLMWHAMLALQATGVEMIDLGLAEPDTAPGLARFKLGTGAALRALGGSWVSSCALPRRRHPVTQAPVPDGALGHGEHAMP
ncbi:MAG: GNAT family N-acetyltransferase [Roseicyclus sp.]|nr:GNAT family N-acetyltransferase [Roseicyclus sp.]